MAQDSLEIEVIARGVLFHEEHVLLCRSVKNGYFYLPGGHVEFGESAESALRREFLEETGLNVTVRACVLLHEHIFRQGSRLRHEYNVVFHVEQDMPSPGKVKSLEPKIAFDWIRASDVHSVDLRPAEYAEWLTSLIRGSPTTTSWRSTP